MPRSSSGLPPLDDTWGGIEQNGCYLVRGETLSEVRLLALQLARTVAERDEACLFASAVEPRELTRQAARLDFDLAEAAHAGMFRLLQPPAALLGTDLPDAARIRALADLTALVRNRRPALFVLDDLAALARFDDPDTAATALETLRAGLAADAIPLVLTVAGNDATHVAALAETRATGVLRLASQPEAEPTARTLTLRLVPEASQPSLWWKAVPSEPGSQGDGASVLESVLEAGIEFLDLSLGDPVPVEHDPLVDTAAQMYTLDHVRFLTADSRDRPRSGPSPSDQEPASKGAPHPAIGATAPLDANLFEHLDVASTLAAFGTEPPSNVPAPPAPRLAFVQAFNAALSAYDSDGQPFLAVALRMPPDHPAAQRFHFVLRALEQTLDERALLLSDERRCRAVWLMRDAAPDAAGPVLEALKHFLRDATSEEAEHMMQTISVALIPNGQPFPNATEFLAHVFDEA